MMMLTDKNMGLAIVETKAHIDVVMSHMNDAFKCKRLTETESPLLVNDIDDEIIHQCILVSGLVPGQVKEKTA